MMVNRQGAQDLAYWREPEAKRSGEGQAGCFLFREEWPKGRGKSCLATFGPWTTPATNIL